jgi:uncharacterized membrane protein
VSRLETRDWRAFLPAVAGGVIIAVGAVLPWMSLFAGLQSYRGISGLYGRLAFAGGVLAVIGGFAMLTRPQRRLRLAIGGLGVALTLFAAWVLLGLRATTQHLDQHPFLLPRAEPGLLVVIAGALIVAALLLPQKSSSHASPNAGHPRTW